MNRWVRRLVVGIVAASWVLTSGVTLAAVDVNALDGLLKQIAAYDFGQSRENLTRISDIIRQAGTSPQELKEIEKRLDDFVRADATYAAKQFVCKELSLIGTEASVAAVAPMLTDEKYSDMARYALERIPGGAVDEALRQALPKASGNAKVGIINTLGVRGDAKAAGLLAALVGDANQTVAGAAVAALGKIADPCATDALAKAKDKATGALRTQVLDAYLQCADRLAAKGQKEAAAAIYKQLYAPAEPLPIRAAALRGMIITAGDKAGSTVVEVLKSSDQPMQTAVIGLLKEVARTDMIKSAAEQLPNLQPAQQVQLLSALADCNDRAALPAVLTAAKSADASVRVAAITAMGVLGDVSSLDMLVETAASAGGAEQKAAQESLYRLRGPDVDATILKKLADAQPKTKVELIRSCDQRNITAAVPVLMKNVRGGDAQVRVESIKALRTVAGPQDLTNLIDLLITTTDAGDRGELEKTVVAVARKIPEDKSQSEKALAALSTAKDLDARCSLLSVLGKIGDAAALPALREALNDKDDKIKDAAIRAFSDWPTAAAAPELLKVAQSSENQVHKTLALRGYVRLIGLESDRPAEETVKLYKQAMDLAPNVAEKRMVLSGLGNTKSFDALQMAAGYLEDAELKQEAEAAVVKIAESTMQKHPQETKELVQKVLSSTKSDSVREQAQRLMRRGN